MINEEWDSREQGWIKDYRSSMSSKIWADAEGYKIWRWILYKTHFSDDPLYCHIKVNKGYITQRIFKGQFLFGRKVAAKELNMDENKVYRWIKKLASPEYSMISEQTKKHYTIIQVINWELYQGNSEQTMNKQRTNNELTMN